MYCGYANQIHRRFKLTTEAEEVQEDEVEDVEEDSEEEADEE